MSTRWKYAAAINAGALALLLGVPAAALPTCTKVGQRACDNGCFMVAGDVGLNAFVCVEVESHLVPEYEFTFTADYEDPPGFSTICAALRSVCREWADEGGSGN